MSEQEIRAAALQAASRVVKPDTTARELIELAVELTGWIETGELPQRKPRFS